MYLDGRPIREEVLIFAALMERKLREHDATKGERGWKDARPSELLQHAREEMDELDAIAPPGADDDPHHCRDDAVDVANLLMMFVDSIGQLSDPEGRVLTLRYVK